MWFLRYVLHLYLRRHRLIRFLRFIPVPYKQQKEHTQYQHQDPQVEFQEMILLRR